jgi:hypothetical protein
MHSPAMVVRQDSLADNNKPGEFQPRRFTITKRNVAEPSRIIIGGNTKWQQV